MGLKRGESRREGREWRREIMREERKISEIKKEERECIKKLFP